MQHYKTKSMHHMLRDLHPSVGEYVGDLELLILGLQLMFQCGIEIFN